MQFVCCTSCRTQRCHKGASILLFIIRLVLWLFGCAALVASFVRFRTEWFRYLTHYTFLGLLISYVWIIAIHLPILYGKIKCVQPDGWPSGQMNRAFRTFSSFFGILYVVSISNTVFVTVTWWIAEYHSLDALRGLNGATNISLHLINTLIVLLDLTFSRLIVHWQYAIIHLATNSLYVALYAVLCERGIQVYTSMPCGKDWLATWHTCCLLYTSPSPRDATLSRMPSSA